MNNLTKKGEKMLEQSKNKHTGVDYVQNMMMWATSNLAKEDILEIIKSADGKVIGLENLQKEVMLLEETLMIKRKELLKKTMALYFMKQSEVKKDDNLLGFNTWMNSLSSRYGNE